MGFFVIPANAPYPLLLPNRPDDGGFDYAPSIVLFAIVVGYDGYIGGLPAPPELNRPVEEEPPKGAIGAADPVVLEPNIPPG